LAAELSALAHNASSASTVLAPARPSIHPAISWALSGMPAHLRSRAEHVIRAMLGARLADPSPDAWRLSRLTGDGFPFEIAFSTADPRLRFTLEPGLAGLDPRLRLGVAIREIGGLAREPVPGSVAESLAAMQAGRSLAFGAWVGCRVGTTDRVFKLYAEVPPDATAGWIGDRPIDLVDRTVVWRMVAYSPVDRAYEWYGRVPSLKPRHLTAVLAPAMLQSEAARVVEVVEEAYGHRVTGRLPGPSVGISYLNRGGAPRVTLHFYARALWGSDARVRVGFQRMARDLGWDPSVYLETTAPIASREDWRTFHGLLSISLDQKSALSLAIGVRPVPW